MGWMCWMCYMNTPLSSSSGLVLGLGLGLRLRFGGKFSKDVAEIEESISCISITWLDALLSISFILRGV